MGGRPRPFPFPFFIGDALAFTGDALALPLPALPLSSCAALAALRFLGVSSARSARAFCCAFPFGDLPEFLVGFFVLPSSSPAYVAWVEIGDRQS